MIQSSVVLEGKSLDSKFVNKRFVTSAGERGTCRWFGTIEGKSGNFYGVEWDDPERGKHDGQGLFKTKFPKAGSFLSASAKNAPADWGRGFLEALKEKYLAKVGDHETVYLGSSNNVIVETVGWEKMERKLSKLDTLKEVGLVEANIAFGESEIESACPLVEDLDLSRNLLSDLEQIGQICKFLPHLRALRLSRNRFAIEPSPAEGSFKKVEMLVLSQTFLDWNSILALDEHFPNLKELGLSFNLLGKVPEGIFDDSFRHLKVLNLENNMLESWDELNPLGHLDSLQELNVSNNKISGISFHGNFKTLTTLNITKNCLSTWIDVHKFNGFEKLVNIRLSGNPITDSEPRSIFLIARLGKMVKINGSDITPKKRLDAECYYLSSAHLALDEPNFEIIHPRYPELCLVHGTPNSKKIETSIAEGLILIYMETPDGNTRVEKRVSKNSTFRVLRTMIARSVWPKEWQKHVKGRLLWKADGKFEAEEISAKYDTKSLEYFEITDKSVFTLS